MAEQRPKEKSKGRGYIQYVGGSTRRGLTVEDFRSIGVSDQDKDVWWDRSNNWRVPREDLTDDAFNRAVKIDSEFVLVGGSEEEGSREEGEGLKPRAAEMTPMPDPPEPIQPPVVGTPFGVSPPEAEEETGHDPGTKS